MRTLLVLMTTVFLQGCSVFGIRTVEVLDYQVLEKEGSFDIRQYEEYWAVRTEIEGSYRESTSRSFRLFLNHGVIIKTPGLEMPVANLAAFFADITSHGRQCINGPDIDATILSAVKRLFSVSTAVRVARFVEYKQKQLPLTKS